MQFRGWARLFLPPDKFDRVWKMLYEMAGLKFENAVLFHTHLRIKYNNQVPGWASLPWFDQNCSQADIIPGNSLCQRWAGSRLSLPECRRGKSTAESYWMPLDLYPALSQQAKKCLHPGGINWDCQVQFLKKWFSPNIDMSTICTNWSEVTPGFSSSLSITRCGLLLWSMNSRLISGWTPRRKTSWKSLWFEARHWWSSGTFYQYHEDTLSGREKPPF